MAHYRIYIMLSIAILLSASSCRKNSLPASPNSPGTTGTPNSRTLTSHDKTVGFKIEAWTVYPYSGGPGEDSVFFSPWIALDRVQHYAVNILKVEVKSKNVLYQAPLWNTIDSGYTYQTGDSSGLPQSIGLWWWQNNPLSAPDADSAFVTFKYYD
jgi:hypothetical protein